MDQYTKHKGNCKLCKTAFTGRRGKMFCSLKCKSTYNYKLRDVTKSATKDIDNILHRNRSILLEVLGKTRIQTKTERLVLDRKNFNYTYVTHFHKNSRNKMVYYLYDMSYIIFSDQEVLIKRIKTKKVNL